MSGRSARQKDISIEDYYAVKIGALWRGVRQESAAFWWVCIYLFFEYIRPQALFPVIDVIPWGIVTLLMACISAFADRSVRWVKNPGNFLVVLFFIVVLLSSMFAFSPSTSFGRMDIITGWVILYFLLITVVNTEKRLIVFLLLFFLVNLKMSQFGARDFLVSGFSGWGVSGSPGWFKDSGDLGIEMTIYVSLVVAFIMVLQQYWGTYKRLFFYIMPLTGLLTIIATASRGAQLGMVAAGILFLFRSGKLVKTVFALLMLGLAIYIIFPPEMIEEFSRAGEDKTSTARLVLWGYGMDVFRNHPWLGVGYKNWLEYCMFTNPEGIGEGVDHCLVAHNSYVQASAEIGISGILVYLSLITLILITNARTRGYAKQIGNSFSVYISHGLDCGLIAYLVGSIFFSVFFYPMFWMQLSMTVALNGIASRQLRDYQGSSDIEDANIEDSSELDMRS